VEFGSSDDKAGRAMRHESIDILAVERIRGVNIGFPGEMIIEEGRRTEVRQTPAGLRPAFGNY
jgi:hypothetical protein